MNALAHQPFNPPIRLSSEQNRLIESATTLVERIAVEFARRYGRFATKHEFITMGQDGLIQAALSYNKSLGVSFATFAGYRIRGAMLDGMRKEMTHAQRKATEPRRAGYEYLETQGDTGNILSETEDDFRQRLHAFSDGLMTSMFAGYVGSLSRGPQDQALEAIESYSKALKALDSATTNLPTRERQIIDLHYKQDMDLKTVAEELGVSYSTIRRTHSTALQRLAVRLKSQGVEVHPDSGS